MDVVSGAHYRGRNHHGRPCWPNSLVTCGDNMTSDYGTYRTLQKPKIQVNHNNHRHRSGIKVHEQARWLTPFHHFCWLCKTLKDPHSFIYSVHLPFAIMAKWALVTLPKWRLPLLLLVLALLIVFFWSCGKSRALTKSRLWMAMIRKGVAVAVARKQHRTTTLNNHNNNQYDNPHPHFIRTIIPPFHDVCW